MQRRTTTEPASSADWRTDNLQGAASLPIERTVKTGDSVRLDLRTDKVLKAACTAVYGNFRGAKARFYREAVLARAALALPTSQGTLPTVTITYTSQAGEVVAEELGAFLGFHRPSIDRLAASPPDATDRLQTLRAFLKERQVPVRVNAVRTAPPPRIQEVGEYELPVGKFTAMLRDSRAELASNGAPNDASAVLVDPFDGTSSPDVVQVQTLEYAALRVLRRLARATRTAPPRVPSANVVMFCEAAQVLVVQKRPTQSIMSELPRDNVFHTFGGAYCPRRPGSLRVHDHGDLLRTARREVLEESNISFSLDSMPLILSVDELDDGFLQWVVLGKAISLYDYQTVGFRERDPEGTVHSLAFSDLEEALLHRSRWHQSGWTHVMAWLAFDAPGSRTPLKFRDRTGGQLFDFVLANAA